MLLIGPEFFFIVFREKFDYDNVFFFYLPGIHCDNPDCPRQKATGEAVPPEELRGNDFGVFKVYFVELKRKICRWHQLKYYYCDFFT